MITVSTKERRCAITTIDNPYDPFEQFTEWLLFDKEKGYNSCEYLARIANTTTDMSQKEESEEIERAIDEIIELNPLNIYKKVVQEYETTENIG